MEKETRIGLFTGTFDPFTIGHQNIVDRVLPLFDKLVIAVAVSKLKHTSEEIEARVQAIKAVFAGEKRVEVRPYADLTIDMARREGARFIVRGVRSAKDFEYEREQADINKQLGGIETLLLFADPRLSSISSSMVRELQFFGKDVAEWLPQPCSGMRRLNKLNDDHIQRRRHRNAEAQATPPQPVDQNRCRKLRSEGGRNWLHVR